LLLYFVKQLILLILKFFQALKFRVNLIYWFPRKVIFLWVFLNFFIAKSFFIDLFFLETFLLLFICLSLMIFAFILSIDLFLFDKKFSYWRKLLRIQWSFPYRILVLKLELLAIFVRIIVNCFSLFNTSFSYKWIKVFTLLITFNLIRFLNVCILIVCLACKSFVIT
jgi:hypothetical protein